MSSDDKQPLLNQPTAPAAAYGPPPVNPVPHHGGYGTTAAGPPPPAATGTGYVGPPPVNPVDPPPAYGGPPPPGQAGYGPPPGQAGYGGPPPPVGHHGHGPPVYQPQVYQPGVPAGYAAAQTVNYKATPVQVRCPNCHQDIITELSYDSGLLVWVVVGIMFLLGLFMLWPLWCCCWIPLVMNDLKDVQHSCPNCHHVCGTYKRM